jgi:small subunit ribosomal protein S2
MNGNMLQNDVLGTDARLDPEIEEMIKAGVHWGHSKTKNHPAMQPYIFGIRNSVSVIDLTKTKEKLAPAMNFIKEMVAKGGMALLVGTRPAAKKIIRETAEKTGMPYLTERWIGGVLTNFKVISKRVEYMENLEKEKANGGWEKYTKKERMKKEEELVKLKKNFDGLRVMKRLPDLVFIVDINEDSTAVREAKRMKIPIVALCDTNSNADLVDYPIPSNDDALPAIRYMVGKVEAAIGEGLKLREQRKMVEEEKKDS